MLIIVKSRNIGNNFCCLANRSKVDRFDGVSIFVAECQFDREQCLPVTFFSSTELR